ncbi:MULTISPECIES: hypothetical protein [unclassified Maridesulfovibrio]|uniref:hypothetical protein n=1 Tax=unclassified Maridesulfovibrio TaxID=2794999 RepID=UPI003B3FF65C
MIPIATIVSFLGSGKGKLLIKIAVVLIVVAIVGIWIVSLKGDIADLKGTISERDSTIAELDKRISALKLEVRTGEVEIEKLNESVTNSEDAVSALRGQVEEDKEKLRRHQIDLRETRQLLAEAKNVPITNSTGVLSHEDSVRVVAHYNKFWGLCSKNATRPH